MNVAKERFQAPIRIQLTVDLDRLQQHYNPIAILDVNTASPFPYILCFLTKPGRNDQKLHP
jgi:hypothetical protein